MRRHGGAVTLCLTGLIVAGCSVAPARPGLPEAPLPAVNLTPFSAVAGRPALRSARLEESPVWQIDMALASHSAIGSGNGDIALLDGETLRLTAETRWRIAPRWQLAAVVPWVRHSPGILDRIIDRWHAVTGLADGQRDRQPEDALQFFYAGTAGRFELDRSVSGPGDVRLELIHALGLPGCPATGCARPLAAALRLGVELDTGDPDRLTGNGAVDYSADLLIGGQRTLLDRSLDWHAQLGVVLPGDGGVVPGAAQDTVTIAAAGLVWRWRPATRLYAQVSASSGFWRSAVGELGGNAAELTVGIGWLTRHGSWHVAVSEDLAIDRSPDVVVRLGWRSQPDPS